MGPHQDNNSEERCLPRFVEALTARVTDHDDGSASWKLLQAARKALDQGESQLDELRICGLRASYNGVEDIVDAIVKSGMAVRHLSMESNDIGDSGVVTLARILDHGSLYRCELASLDLRGNNVGPEGCKLLAEHLSKNVTLTSLDLSSNPLGNVGASFIAQLLAENTTITRLIIGNTEMTERGFAAMSAILRAGNSTLRELSIGGQLIRSREEVVAYQAARVLETSCCALRSLELQSSGIGDEGSFLLCDALAQQPTMEHLDLSRNQIGITGGQALARLLLANPMLTGLVLQANRITDEGAKAFRVVLLHNKTLTTLDLRYNDIHDPGLEALAEGMECNSSVERLLVWGNHFGLASLERFAGLEEGRFALVGFFLDVKPFVVDGEYHAAERVA